MAKRKIRIKRSGKVDGRSIKAYPKHDVRTRMKDGDLTAIKRLGRMPGTTLLQNIKEQLRKAAWSKENKAKGMTVQDECAQAYIRQMRKGSFIHSKEIFEREDGKTPNTIQNADGTAIKAYIGIPIDDDEEAP